MKSVKRESVCDSANSVDARRLATWAGQQERLVRALGQIAGGNTDV